MLTKVPKILVIDDEPLICQVVAEALESHAIVDFHKTGWDNLRAAKTHEYDLIITDLCMDDISGETIIKHIHKQKPNQPIVVITAGKRGKIHEEALLNLGVIRIFHKPFGNLETFAAHVMDCLRFDKSVA
jgi:DNA-binding response OmpR family regulator